MRNSIKTSTNVCNSLTVSTPSSTISLAANVAPLNSKPSTCLLRSLEVLKYVRLHGLKFKKELRDTNEGMVLREMVTLMYSRQYFNFSDGGGFGLSKTQRRNEISSPLPQFVLFLQIKYNIECMKRNRKCGDTRN